METPEANLHFLLHSAALVEDRLRHRLAILDLGPRQARVIDALGRMGTASQISLAREFDVTPASMSTMTTRLITAGFISRETNPAETRSNVLRLTKRGQDILSEIHEAWESIDRLITSRVGSEKAALLAELTRELRDELGGRGPGV